MPIKPEDIKLEEPLKEGESPMKQQKQFLAVGQQEEDAEKA